MASPIIKKATAQFQALDFDDLAGLTGTIIHQPRVLPAEGDEASKLDRRIIRGADADYAARPVKYLDILQNDGPSSAAPIEEPVEQLSPEEEMALREAEWEARLAAAVEEARSAGYAAGRDAMRAELEAGFAADKQALLDDTARIGRLWADLLEKSEPIMLEMMLDLLEAILHQPLPEQVVGLVENSLLTTMEVFSRETPIRLSLNSIDYLRLQESGLVAHLTSLFPKLVWDPQPDLREGDWVAQCPERMIRSIVSESIHHLKDSFGLLEPHSRIARVAASAPAVQEMPEPTDPDAPELS
ncbi:MAG: hypothetical protein R2834_21310 [Rhodothermales bacterium]